MKFEEKKEKTNYPQIIHKVENSKKYKKTLKKKILTLKLFFKKKEEEKNY